MKDEKVMITCCSDGTRPVIFKIERLDYKVLYIDGISCDGCREKIRSALETLDGVSGVTFREEFAEVFPGWQRLWSGVEHTGWPESTEPPEDRELEKFCFSALFLLTKSVRIIIIFL